MKNSKNDLLNKVIIHKYPIVERMIMMFGSIILTFIPLICLIVKLYNNDSELIKIIILLIAMLLFCFIMYLNAFKIYICLDITEKKIIIREGLKKEELSTMGLMSITVEDDSKYPNLFSLNYNFIGHSKKDYGWSTGPGSRVLFGTAKTQRKRLEKFCEDCNKYLYNK